MENDSTDPVGLELAGYETTGYEMTVGIKKIIFIFLTVSYLKSHCFDT